MNERPKSERPMTIHEVTAAAMLLKVKPTYLDLMRWKYITNRATAAEPRVIGNYAFQIYLMLYRYRRQVQLIFQPSEAWWRDVESRMIERSKLFDMTQSHQKMPESELIRASSSGNGIVKVIDDIVLEP